MFLGYCSKFAICVHRLGETADAIESKNRSRLLKLILRSSLYILRFLSVVICKIFIQEGTKIGKRVFLSSKGNIIVGAEQIGDNCVIHHNVTFGMNLNKHNFTGKPKIGDQVWIGPNTIIHGDVKIGKGVTILGGTVLTKNIPDRCIVSGNPGRIVHRDFDNSKLLNSPLYIFNMQSLDIDT